MHRILKHINPNNNPPKIRREQTNIEKCRGGQPEQDRRQRVEDEEAECVTRQISANVAIPRRAGEGITVEDGSLHADDEHAVQTQLAQDFIHGPLADEVFLCDVGEAVATGAYQGEKVTLDLAAAGWAVAATTSKVVRGEQHTHATNGDEDTQDLRPVVADAQEQKREDNHDDDSPEVDELCA